MKNNHGVQINHDEFDELNVSVRKDKLDKLLSHYAVLGFKPVDRTDDPVFYDVVHLTLLRPHKVAHKDELQLLQVYIETAWNKIGKHEKGYRPKTLIFSLLSGLLGLGLIVAGLILAFSFSGLIYALIGWLLVAGGCLSIICCGAGTGKLYKVETEKSKATVLGAIEEIKGACARAAVLTADEEQKEVAISEAGAENE